MFFRRHLPWYASLKSRLFHAHDFTVFEKLLIGVSIVLAIFFTLVIPPFQKPDEDDHFLRTVSVASGTIVCLKNNSGLFENKVPTYLAEFPTTLLSKHIASDKKVTISLPYYKQLLTNRVWDQELSNEPGSCSLPFLPYLPAAMVLTIPVHIGWNPFIIFYLGRITNALLALIVCCWAIKKTPEKLRLVPLLLVATPMFIHQLTSYSKDAFHLSFGLLTFAYLLHFHENRPIIKLRELAMFFCSLLLTLIARPQYFPLALLAFMIPDQRIKKIPLSIHQLALGFVLGLIGLLAVALSMEIFSANASSVGNESPYPYIYPNLQWKYLQESPTSLVTLIDQTFASKVEFYSKSAVGILGWLEYSLPWWVFPLYGGLGWYVLFKTHGKWQPLSFFQWTILTLGIGGSIVGLFLAMYLYGSPVASPVVEGLQGRYFLLLIPFAYWWLGATFAQFGRSIATLVATATVVGICWTVVARYYYNTDHYYRAPIAPSPTTVGTIPYQDLKNYPIATISGVLQQQFPVEPNKKLAGVALYVLPSKRLLVKPYRISILGADCSDVQRSTVLSVAKLEPFALNDVRFPQMETPTSGTLCLQIEPYYSEVTQDEALMVLLTNHTNVAIPLYLH